MWMSSHLPFKTRRSMWRTTAIVVAVFVGVSCSDDENGPTNTVTEGSIQVQVTTTGSDLDPDGYTVLVDGANGQAVGLDGSVTFSDLAEGNHEVSIDGVAANCSVTGDNPRTVAVTAGEVAQTAFDVVCTAIVGNLTIITSTSGGDIDPDGFQYSIDGGAAEAIGVNDTVTVELSADDHTVQLLDVAANCTVEASNLRTVSVPAGGTTSTEFVVTCSTLAGSLVATTSTTGVDLDPDGYTVEVDGSISQAIGLDETITINGIPAGDRSVELTGLANNCSVVGDNPRTVTIVANTAVQTDFAVECVDILGTVDVITSTTGDDIDPSGYTVRVEGVPDQAVGVNDTVSVTDVVWGDRTVELLNLESNCTVDGDNPRTVTVPQEGVVETTFTVSCVPLEGDLTVTASTTGGDLDPDGYTVSVDGATSLTLDTNGSVTFIDLEAGDRSVELSGIAPNCAVTGNNPVTVTVPPSGGASHTFDITCTAVVGSVEVTTSTTGADIDPDGYSVSIDGELLAAIGTSETVTVDSVSAGDRMVELTGLASNCSVDGQNPRTVNVLEGDTVFTTFDVTCEAQLSNQIVFDTDRDGNEEIYVMNPDGSGLQRLTTNAARDAEPYVSPDGTKIAFVSDRDGDNEIWVMGADGSNPVQLTFEVGSDREPAWSPDGTMIAFTSDRDGDDEIFVMNADGTNQTQLTFEAGRDGLPDWSPDGSKIVYTSFADGDGEIVVMNASDGSGKTQLTDNAVRDFAPAWSPDGSQIAFTSERDVNREVYVMTSSGGNPTNLSNNAAADLAPQWSPDGSQIAFASSRDGNNEVYVMTSSGASQINITNNAADDFEVSWSR